MMQYHFLRVDVHNNLRAVSSWCRVNMTGQLESQKPPVCENDWQLGSQKPPECGSTSESFLIHAVKQVFFFGQSLHLITSLGGTGITLLYQRFMAWRGCECVYPQVATHIEYYVKWAACPKSGVSKIISPESPLKLLRSKRLLPMMHGNDVLHLSLLSFVIPLNPMAQWFLALQFKARLKKVPGQRQILPAKKCCFPNVFFPD